MSLGGSGVLFTGDSATTKASRGTGREQPQSDQAKPETVSNPRPILLKVLIESKGFKVRAMGRSSFPFSGLNNS
jgi:hypothetical protein